MPSVLNIYVGEIDPTEEALVVSLVGEADIETAPVLRGCLLRLLNRCQSPLILDLSRLEFIDSSGVSALISGYQRARQYDCELCATALTSAVAKVFGLTALDTIVPTYASVVQACRAQLHLDLDQPPIHQAPIPIENFLMQRNRVGREGAPARALG